MYQLSEAKEKRIFWIFFILCQLVCITGWVIPLMDIDAAQYANMSREMLLNKHYLEIYDLRHDYLDKPPMIFWLGSLSMRIFGIHDYAYRLPSLLFSQLAIFSTYKLARLFYSQRIALLSALVLASCEATFLINHDVKTDTMLMGWVAFSLWQLAAWYQDQKWRQLILASVGIAGGLLTKGPIAFMVPVFAFAPHFILHRSYRQFFRWQYLVMIGIIAVLLLPMSIGLYRQFDLHPEKIMYGQKGISGLRFFYWTQSFGRITGESTWHENDRFSFLFENMLWGFMPWIVFFILGFADDLIGIVRKRFKLSGREEWISTGGFAITYCALASSRAQLPHYIYVVFPLAAIITGKFLYRLIYESRMQKWLKPLTILQFTMMSITVLVLFTVLAYPFRPVDKTLLILAVLICSALIWILLKNKIEAAPLISVSVLTVAFVNLFLNLGFYPRLLEYQLSIPVSRWINQQPVDRDRFYVYKLDEHESLHFYSNHFFRHVENPDSLSTGDYILTGDQGYRLLDTSLYRMAFAGSSFHVSTLSLTFMNPARRASELSPYYILEKIRKDPTSQGSSVP